MGDKYIRQNLRLKELWHSYWNWFLPSSVGGRLLFLGILHKRWKAYPDSLGRIGSPSETIDKVSHDPVPALCVCLGKGEKSKTVCQLYQTRAACFLSCCDGPWINLVTPHISSNLCVFHSARWLTLSCRWGYPAWPAKILLLAQLRELLRSWEYAFWLLFLMVSTALCFRALLASSLSKVFQAHLFIRKAQLIGRIITT